MKKLHRLIHRNQVKLAEKLAKDLLAAGSVVNKYPYRNQGYGPGYHEETRVSNLIRLWYKENATNPKQAAYMLRDSKESKVQTLSRFVRKQEQEFYSIEASCFEVKFPICLFVSKIPLKDLKDYKKRYEETLN